MPELGGGVSSLKSLINMNKKQIKTSSKLIAIKLYCALNAQIQTRRIISWKHRETFVCLLFIYPKFN
jgi:hypothetical protein